MQRIKKGQIVWVHPDLTRDPYGFKDRPLKVLSVSKRDDIVFVLDERTHSTGRYEYDALVTTKEYNKETE